MDKKEFINELKPALAELEYMRKAQLKLINRGYMYYGVALFLVFVGFFFIMFGKWYAIICIGVAMLVLRVRPLDIGNPAGKYRTFYKHKIIETFAKRLNPTIVFKSNRFIFQQILERSGLFGQVGFIEGEDHFEGRTKNGYSFQFSEVLVQSQGIRHVDLAQGALFDGLLFIIKSPEKLADHLMILPKTTSKKGELETATSIRDKVTVGLVNVKGRNARFEQDYMVYSKNRADATHLLSLELLEFIQQLSEEWEMLLKISFVKDKIYLALPSSVNYFEKSVAMNAKSQVVVQNIYRELTESLNVAERISEVLGKIRIPETKTKIELEEKKIKTKENWDNGAYDHFIDDGF